MVVYDAQNAEELSQLFEQKDFDVAAFVWERMVIGFVRDFQVGWNLKNAVRSKIDIFSHVLSDFLCIFVIRHIFWESIFVEMFAFSR